MANTIFNNCEYDQVISNNSQRVTNGNYDNFQLYVNMHCFANLLRPY